MHCFTLLKYIEDLITEHSPTIYSSSRIAQDITLAFSSKISFVFLIQFSLAALISGLSPWLSSQLALHKPPNRHRSGPAVVLGLVLAPIGSSPRVAASGRLNGVGAGRGGRGGTGPRPAGHYRASCAVKPCYASRLGRREACGLRPAGRAGHSA